MDTDTRRSPIAQRRPRRVIVVGGGRRRNLIILFCLALAALLIWFFFFRQKPQPPAHHGFPVTAAAVGRGTIPIEIRSFGTVSPMNAVSVKSRVAGTLMQIHFAEGQAVARGQLLFTIDPRPLQAAYAGAQADVEKQQAVIVQSQAAIDKDQAAVQQAQANLNRDIAQQRNAQVEATRYASLVREGAVSMEQYQQYQTNSLAAAAVTASDRAAIKNARAVVAADVANLKNARAQLAASQAALQNAAVQLSYATIVSPIAGKAGNIQVLLGNDVKPDQDVLVTVNQISPIYVQFSVPQAQFPQVQAYAQSGTEVAIASQPNGGPLAAGGRVTFVDNTVDAATGTVRIKAIFDNAEGHLWPGQYVNINLQLTTLPNAVVVPDQAVQTGQNGDFVWVIRKDKTVYMQPVRKGPSANGLTAILSGLNVGQLVVTDGQLQLSKDAHVTIKPAPRA